MAYEQSFAQFYDRFADEADYRARAAYQIEILRAHGISDGLLLDAACGTGTLTRYYLEAGFDPIAVDASADMLMLAREKLSEWQDRTLFLCQRLEELDLYGTVRAGVCSLDSLNHLLSEEALLAALRRICLFTEPGGVFICDMNTVRKHREVLADNTFVFEDAEAFLVWQNELDEDTDVVNMTFDMFTKQRNGTYLRAQDENAERAYPTAFVLDCLRRAGFRPADAYADLSFATPKGNEERLCFVAEK